MSSSSIITANDPIVEKMSPVHPGEMLREDFMMPLGFTSYSLAKRLHVPRTRIERLIREETSLSPDTALRLGRFFRTGAAFWFNLNSRYELQVAERGDLKGLEEIVPLNIIQSAA